MSQSTIFFSRMLQIRIICMNSYIGIDTLTRLAIEIPESTPPLDFDHALSPQQ